MSEDAELLEVFVQEAREHLDNLEPDILSLETDPDNTEIINRIFRAVHSIKGASGFFGLTTISGLAHVMENLMALVRDGSLKLTQPMIDALLAGSDKLRIMIEDVGNSNSIDTEGEKKVLIALLEGDTEGAGTAITGDTNHPKFLGKFQPEGYFLKDGIKFGQIFYEIDIWLKHDIERKKKAILDFFKELETLGTIIDAATNLDKLENEHGEDDVNVSFLFSSVMQPDLVLGVFDVSEKQMSEIDKDAVKEYLSTLESKAPASPSTEEAPKVELEVKAAEQAEPVEEKQQSVPTAQEPVTKPVDQPEELGAKTGTTKKADETIRLSVSILDDLMNLAGELVLGRNQLMRIGEKASKEIEGLGPIIQNVNMVTSELQEKVMQTRLQAIGSIFGKFNRIIRDLSKKLSKDIRLETNGEDVELDKSIIEALSDPLTHMIRNCADHAIELPDEREAAGKNRQGVVRLTAAHVGGHVHIEITDDGRGIYPEKIKNSAIKKKVITEEEGAKMSDKQLINLIFAPGFSTAAQVSDVSGRGVGMDVVRTNIEQLGGNVELESEPGKGTRFCLKLPLTLAIIPSMIVGVEKRRFAVPQVNLEEIVRLSANNKIESVRGTTVLRLREQLLPLVNLQSLLKIKEEMAEGVESPPVELTQDTVPENGYVLVLKVEKNRFGLIVEKLYDNEEIVVKPLSSHLKAVAYYSGSTIMGDGKVAMILDASGIASEAQLKFTDIEEQIETEKDLGAGEKQPLLFFRNEGAELFALNLAMVSRIEKITPDQIDKIGDKEYMKYADGSLRLLRLDDFMQIKKPEKDGESLYVIIPKLVKQPMGIIAQKVEDARECEVNLNEDSINGTGILGSCILNENLTIFIDVYELFEKAEPDVYKSLGKVDALRGKKVLLAEDTPFFRAVISQYLKESECQLDVTNNGQDAWEHLSRTESCYDIVVTDIEMPYMDGFELIKRIRSTDRLKELPIVAISALSADQYVERGKNLGVNAYEVKLNKEKLKSTLEDVLAVQTN